MLSSISPVGEAARGQRWAVTVTAYTVASALAGTALGAVLGSLGALVQVDRLGAWRWGLLAVTLLVGSAWDAGLIPRELPSWQRQVDVRWLTAYRGWVYGAGYGAQLGIAVATIITSAVTYAALLTAVLLAAPRGGALVGATFGLVRSVPLLLTVRVRSPQALQRVHARLDAVSPQVTRTAIAGQLVASGVAVLVVATASGGSA